MATTKTDKKTQVNTGDLSKRAIALAEQLGRIAGTIEGTAESWINRASLNEQITRVRDGATQLLNSLAKGRAPRRKSAKAVAAKGSARGTSGNVDLAHAPGKRHRKPGPTLHGVKKSDERIPKMRIAEANRQRRRSHA